MSVPFMKTVGKAHINGDKALGYFLFWLRAYTVKHFRSTTQKPKQKTPSSFPVSSPLVLPVARAPECGCADPQLSLKNEIRSVGVEGRSTVGEGFEKCRQGHARRRMSDGF
jgi:hypothetical protein